MRVTAFLLILIGIASMRGQEAQVYWGESINNFSLGLSVSNSAYDLAKPILATVYTRNDASVDASLATFPQRWILSFEATDKSRKPIKPKEAGGYDGSAGGRQLAPGEVFAETIDLRDYLYLTNEGRFVVTAKRLLFWPTFAISGNAIIEIASTNKSSTAESNHVVRGNAAAPTTTTTNSRVGSGASMRTPDPVTAVPSSASTLSTPSSAESQDPEATGANATRRIAVGIVAILMALILVIIWRARSRRKSDV